MSENNNQLSHYEQAREHGKQGLHKSTVKLGEISQGPNPHPHTMKEAAGQIGQAAFAGRKELGKAGYHAGMGFMQGVSQQNPNSGQQLNNMKIEQSIAQASGSANRGISSFKSKASGQASGASKSSSNGASKGASGSSKGGQSR